MRQGGLISFFHSKGGGAYERGGGGLSSNQNL